MIEIARRSLALDSIFTVDGIIELLQLAEQYIVYVYPGFVTLVIYRFAMSKSVEENKNTFIKSIIISYLYTLPLLLIFGIYPTDFEIVQHIIIILLAIIVPLAWNIILRCKRFKSVIRRLGIKTEIYDNLMDIMFYKENGGVWVRAFMDEQNVMYEGSLRHYESDIAREQQVILSGYRQYHFNEQTKKYEVIYDYSDKQENWVRILERNITRIEFVYQNPQ